MEEGAHSDEISERLNRIENSLSNNSVSRHLVTFIDFLYAAIISLALQNTYKIMSASTPVVDKLTTAALFLFSVYFVTHD